LNAKKRASMNEQTRRRLIFGTAVGALVLVTWLGGTVWSRWQARRKLERETKDRQRFTVSVARAKRDTATHELILPGNIQAFQETVIYARANGYLREWRVEIGDKVTNAQLLATIETPEIDKELDQARATLRETEANLELARVSAERWQELLKQQVVSPQENDQQQSAYQARRADAAAAQANVARLEKLQGFERVVAPFAGTITSRRVDVGALVSAGSGTVGTALFDIAQTNPLRIYVNVPQADALDIRDGLVARVSVTELPETNFEGRVAHTAGALDPASRTLLTEVQIPNRDGVLYPGMYGQVKFALVRTNAPVIIPATAFVFRPEGPQVAVLTKEHRVHWQSIEVGRDFGTRVEAISGIEDNTPVILSPSDDLVENMIVDVRFVETGPREQTPH